MAQITLKTANHVVPMIYAYTTPEIVKHNGWTKIGYTEQDDVEDRIRQQLQTAHIPHNPVTRAKMQVVCVGKLNLRSDLFQICGAEAPLDGSLRSNIHKNRRLRSSMGTGKLPSSGFALCAQYSKHSAPPL